MKGQKELEEVLFKKLFLFKLSAGKHLLILNWAELGITTVDTRPTAQVKRILIPFLIPFRKLDQPF